MAAVMDREETRIWYPTFSEIAKCQDAAARNCPEHIYLAWYRRYKFICQWVKEHCSWEEAAVAIVLLSMSLDERLAVFGEITVKSSIAEGILDKKFRAGMLSWNKLENNGSKVNVLRSFKSRVGIKRIA